MVDGLVSPKVPLMKVAQLKSMMGKGTAIQILDSREKKEFNVSHIEGAKYCGYDHFSTQYIAALDKSKPVIVYCSVGYRSGKIGEKLKEMGFKEVYNLYGGIFDWVNSGYPVVNAKGTTDQVHGYNLSWGKWLRRGEKVYE